MKLTKIIAGAALAVLASCSGNNGWQVSGTIDGAPEGAKVALLAQNPAGGWYAIDSLEVSANGEIKYQAPDTIEHFEIYGLSLNGNTIYFPVIADETITIKAKASDLEGTYTIEGSDAATAMRDISQKINKQVKEKGVDAVLADSVLKRELNEAALADTVGIVAYYIINKSIGGQPLYSADNSRDVAMLGAVAQKFKTSLPDDPRTKMLEAQFIEARKRLGKGPVVEVEGQGYIDIALYDEKGKVRTLSEVVEANPVVLLSFTSYAQTWSPAYNSELAKVQEGYGDGLAIYQVSVDEHEADWRSTATNLPWTTVQNDPLNSANLVMQYNVGAVPLTYVIIDGNLVERVEDPTQLADAINKHSAKQISVPAQASETSEQ